MSRERSPKRELAFKLWVEGLRIRKLSSIAKELDVTPELIRKWKYHDNWDKRPDPGPRKRGAPKGSKNALGNKGGGAPKRNDNAFKHGEYSAIWEDILTDDERVKLMFVETDPFKQAENEIRFLELRERRMLQLRAQIMDGWDGRSIFSKSESFQRKIEGIGDIPTFNEDGELVVEKRIETYMQEVERTTKTPHKLERILAIEDALTRVQDKKAKWVDMLWKIDSGSLSKEEAELRISRMKLENKAMADKEW